MKFIYKILFVATITLVLFSCKSRHEQVVKDTTIKKRSQFRFMFYNVENLFDIYDDSIKNDNEFLPDQAKFWTKYKYSDKLKNIYQVITSVGEWECPELIGLCEIENRLVLDDLLNKTPLSAERYGIVHYESPDKRGIDVALLYKKSAFTVDYSQPIKIKFPQNLGGRPTRDILYTRGRTIYDDTLHVFINHWPSRWGGQLETEPKRMHCAKVLKKVCDSIMRDNPDANILISGDLNDHPTDRSLLESLKTRTDFTEDIRKKSLYNMSYYLQEELHLGSHKYKGYWGVLDQIIVSSGLMDKESSLYSNLSDAHIFKEDFLLTEDEKHSGKQLYRTYIGYKYQGGFSDHLPIYLDINFNRESNSFY